MQIDDGLGNFVDDLRKELYESDGIEWFAQDPIYEYLADGFPTLTKEIIHRDFDYPIFSEFVVNTIRRLELEDRNKLGDIKTWIYNFVDSMAQKSPSLEDELNKAYTKGKTKKQLVSLVLTDLERTKEKGCKKPKYLPLIEKQDGKLCLSPYARELFNPAIIKKYGSEWVNASKSIKNYERMQMNLPYIGEN